MSGRPPTNTYLCAFLLQAATSPSTAHTAINLYGKFKGLTLSLYHTTFGILAPVPSTTLKGSVPSMARKGSVPSMARKGFVLSMTLKGFRHMGIRRKGPNGIVLGTQDAKRHPFLRAREPMKFIRNRYVFHSLVCCLLTATLPLFVAWHCLVLGLLTECPGIVALFRPQMVRSETSTFSNFYLFNFQTSSSSILRH